MSDIFRFGKDGRMYVHDVEVVPASEARAEITLSEARAAVWESRCHELERAAKRVLEADMRGDRDLDALNALEDAAGLYQQGQADAR